MNELMMNVNPVFVAALLVVMAGAIGLGIWALKTGRVTGDMLASGTAMLEGVQSAADALAKATKNPAVSIASYIMKAAAQAARAAEQMYNTGAISAQERNETAKRIAGDLLTLAGIEVTEDRKTAIAVLLEAECDAMGHHMELAAEGMIPEFDNGQLVVDDWSDEQIRQFMRINAPEVDISGCETREQLMDAFDTAFPAPSEEQAAEINMTPAVSPSRDEPVTDEATLHVDDVPENPSHDDTIDA